MSISFNDYQETVHKFAKYQTGCDAAGVPPLVYVLLGLGEEAGEVLGKYKKIIRDKNGVISNDDMLSIKKELGDVMWYLSEAAYNLGMTLEEVAQTNVDKLTDRNVRNVIGGSGDNR